MPRAKRLHFADRVWQNKRQYSETVIPAIVQMVQVQGVAVFAFGAFSVLAEPAGKLPTGRF